MDRIETEPGSPAALDGPAEGACRMSPTPNLLAEPSSPSAKMGLAGGGSGDGMDL